MDSAAWDAKYSKSELIWGAPPNSTVVEFATSMPRGLALDVAGGEGRNALWLATRGWEVTSVDFSPVALEKGRAVAAGAPRSVQNRITWLEADVLDLVAEPSYDLILILYLHLPPADRRHVIRTASTSLKDDGILMILGHDKLNLSEGVGGPQEIEILYTPEDLAADVGSALTIDVCEQRRRSTPAGTAIDSLVVARNSGIGTTVKQA